MIDIPLKLSRKNLAYVARINGLDKTYILDRQFLETRKEHWSKSGKTGTAVVTIVEDGYYEIRDNASWDTRKPSQFIWVKGQEHVSIDRSVVVAAFS